MILLPAYSLGKSQLVSKCIFTPMNKIYKKLFFVHFALIIKYQNLKWDYHVMYITTTACLCRANVPPFQKYTISHRNLCYDTFSSTEYFLHRHTIFTTIGTFSITFLQSAIFLALQQLAALQCTLKISALITSNKQLSLQRRVYRTVVPPLLVQ